MLDDIEPEPIDFEAELAKIRENKVISRQTLFETFKPMLPTNQNHPQRDHLVYHRYDLHIQM